MPTWDRSRLRKRHQHRLEGEEISWKKDTNRRRIGLAGRKPLADLVGRLSAQSTFIESVHNLHNLRESETPCALTATTLVALSLNTKESSLAKKL